MLNGVKNNDGISNSQLDRQSEISKVLTNPIKNPYANIDKNLLIDETAISTEAVKLYQKDIDIKKFSALVLSDFNDNSHEMLVSNLFKNGVSDPLSEDMLGVLARNQSLMDDLSL